MSKQIKILMAVVFIQAFLFSLPVNKFQAPGSDIAVADQVTADPVTAAPVTADPVTTDPVTADPVTTDPVTADPVTTDPVTADPVTADPVTTDPVTADPVTTDPVTADPVTVDPVTTDEAVVDPVTTDEAGVDPVTTDEAVVDPVATDEAVVDPVTTDEAVVDPVATDEAVVDPVTTDEAGVDPVATDEAVVDPVTADPVTTDEAVVDPVTTDEAVVDPVATDEAVVDPVTTDEAVVDPVATDEAVVDPVTVDVTADTTAETWVPAVDPTTYLQPEDIQAYANIGLVPNNVDQLPDTLPKEAPSELLVPHIQVDVEGVENGGIQFFGTQTAPQVINEDGVLTPPAPPPGSGLPIPPDAIATLETFIGQPGGTTFNAPDVAVPVVLVPLSGAIASIPGAQAINRAFNALANVGNDMSPITRKKAKKLLVVTLVGQIVAMRRRIG